MKNNRKAIFFTSDLHIGHANVIKFSNRPFRDLDHMHQVLIRNFNASVPKDGVCYFLGDIGMGSSELVKSIISQLNGTKILIVGNHDKGYNAMYNMGFDAVMHGARMQIAGETVTLSHCPLRDVYREDTTGMRGSDGSEPWHGNGRKKSKAYSFRNHGQLHLQGHIHSPNSGKSIRSLGRQLDVGVDSNNYTPVSLSTIESWVCKTKKLKNTWKDVVGFDGYKVNCLGEVMSFRRYLDGRYIKPYKDKDGYLCMSLRIDGKAKAQKVHRIVAKAFLTGFNEALHVNHKDGHKLNNSISNLEWCTHTENQRHAWYTGLRTSKLTIDDVLAIKALIKKGVSNTEIAKIYSVDQSLISNIKTGKIWKGVKNV